MLGKQIKLLSAFALQTFTKHFKLEMLRGTKQALLVGGQAPSLRYVGNVVEYLSEGGRDYRHVTQRSSISSIPDYSGISIKDRIVRGGEGVGDY